MRRLGYLVPQFPGQTHIFFWREIAELESRGVEVHLFSTRPPPPGLVAHDWSEAAIRRTAYLGTPRPGAALAALPRLRLRQPMREARREKAGALRDLMLAVPAAGALIAEARRRGIDHVHVHSCGRSALIAALAATAGGPAYSLTLHGPLSDYGPLQAFKWRNARFATVITDRLMGEVRAELAPDLPPRLTIQPMGVDTADLARDTAYAPATPGGPLRLFSCGRLNVVKGHQDLMQAVRLLVDRGHDVSLDVAGEDDAGGSGYRKVLEARIAELGLADRVTLLGAIDAGRVRERLLGAHAFVLASWHEPLGVALMEAMSCGVPTIGTAAGGVAELITDGVDGLLVPPKDPEALAEAIAELAADPDCACRIAAAGRARVVAAFHSGRGAEAIIEGLTVQQLCHGSSDGGFGSPSAR